MTSYASHIPHVPLSQPMAPRPTNYPAPSRTLWDLTAQPLPKPSHSRLKQSRVHVHIPFTEFPSDDQTYEYLHLRGSNLPAKNADAQDFRIPAFSWGPAFKLTFTIHEFPHISFQLTFTKSSIQAGVHDFRIPALLLSRLPNSCVVVGPAFKLMFKTSELLRYRWSSVQAIVPNSPIPAFPWFQRQR
ncbi:hypothetical protein R3P38DRAFT_3292282 [Favolaschia claudopus]|uniref:Uncharacterized protein n=1 Tax=Favolaschia claudopus TaxID=2862362 RepID=A0AAV9ZKM4_9AGAR